MTAGPDNQPEAVRAMAMARMQENTKVGTLPGMSAEIRFKSSAAPWPSAGDFEDAKSILNGACVAAKADLLWATQEGAALFVGIRGTYEKSVIVEDLARRAMPRWSKIEVFYEGESAPQPALPPSFYDACYDAAHTEEVWQYPSPSATAQSRGCWDDIAFAVSRVVLESIRRLHDQLASGGVDCPETRAANLARVKDEARVVGEMQDAVGMVASWAMKPARCVLCGARCGVLGVCTYCAHRRHTERTCVETEGKPGIAIDRTPGPHEGACAWASATWESDI